MSTQADDRDQGAAGAGTRPGGRYGSTTDEQTLQDFLVDLQQRTAQLATDIKQGKATLADQEGRQQKLKKQVTDVERTATDLVKTRTDGEALLAEIDQSLAAAASLIKSLDEDARADIDRRLAAIDQAISDAADVVDAQTAEADRLQQECDRLQGEAAARQTAYDQALSGLTALPAVLKQQMATVKGLRTELDAAHAAGQALKACVLAAEVTAHRTRLEELLAADHEEQLVSEVRSAGKDLSDAREALAEGQAALTDQQDVVTRRSAELKALQDGRAAAVQELYTASPYAAQAAPAA
jgi:chromosome segregation ATPase